MASFLERLKEKQAAAQGGAVSTATAAAPAPDISPNPLPPDAPSRETPVVPAAVADPPADSAEAVETAPAPTNPPRRGRPRKTPEEKAAAKAAREAEKAAREAEKASAPPAAPAATATTPAATATTPAATAATAANGFTLYIDCMPVKKAGEGYVTSFEDWIAPAIMALDEEVAQSEKLPSYVLLPYAKEKAAFVLSIKEQASKGLPPTMMISTGGHNMNEAISTLIPMASHVVKGTR